nr:putative disease resistance protein rga3 [Quercus suber]
MIRRPQCGHRGQGFYGQGKEIKTREFENSKVDILIDPSSRQWNEEMLYGLFNTEEAELIKTIPLSNEASEDVLFWPHSSNGQYSCKSGYRFLEKEDVLHNEPQEVTDEEKQLWNGIWSMHVPPKVKTLLWRACREAIPTMSALFRRTISTGSSCVRCHANSEDSKHALWSCPELDSVWSDIELWSFRSSVQFMTFKELLSWLIKNNHQPELFAVTVWTIWNQRNRVRLNQLADSLHQIPNIAKSWLADYHARQLASASPVQREKNMGRKRDRFWDYAQDLKGRFKCNYCKHEFPGGASRIKSHLAGVKGRDILICDFVPEDVQKEAYEATQRTNKKLKNASISSSDKGSTIPSTSVSTIQKEKIVTQSEEEYIDEIVLDDVVGRLVTKAFSLATKDIIFKWGFKEELENLFDSLYKIKVVLYQKRQVSDEFVRIWLMELRNVAYEVDNVLDKFDYEIIRQKVQPQSQMIAQVCSFSFYDHNKVETIKQSLDKLVDDVAGFGLRIELLKSIIKIRLDKNEDSLLNDSEVIGREFDVVQILNKLISSSNQQVISVLPIVDEGYRIKEMGHLKNLRGEINIYNLEKVEDEEEAKSAKLKEKEIFKLGLYWSSDREEDMHEENEKVLEGLQSQDMYDEDEMVLEGLQPQDMYDKDEKVLEGLQPHPNLKSLTIKWYLGKKFPSWVGLSSLYHNLIEINLMRCWNCEEVPTLGQLPCLRVLEIIGMGKVRCIGSEFYFNSDGSYSNTTTKLFPALRILKLEEMETLEEWKDAKELTTADEVLFVFPCLEELTILQCWELRDLPDSLHTCVSLQKLVVQECYELRSLPGVRWSIIRCGIEDPASGLQCVEYLENGDCRLPSSSTSSIHPSLQKLKLYRSVLLLDQIQYFIALKILWIERFYEMVALPEGLGNLSSLQQLYIVHCWKLVHLPTEEAMRCLTQLKTLIIYFCPKFEDNERIKISHVPWVRISDDEYE